MLSHMLRIQSWQQFSSSLISLRTPIPSVPLLCLLVGRLCCWIDSPHVHKMAVSIHILNQHYPKTAERPLCTFFRNKETFPKSLLTHFPICFIDQNSVTGTFENQFQARRMALPRLTRLDAVQQNFV